MSNRRFDSRGVSLLEALVALAVMAFGMLGVVGLQSNLRFNGDVAKQRSEAVRLIQAKIEERRNFSTINSAVVGQKQFDSISSSSGAPVPGTNASFTVTETVVPDSEALPMKTLRVAASWNDRTNQLQSAQATTIISRSSPEVSAALVAPAGGGAAQLPGGRNSAIPRSATDLGNGTSRLDLPPPVAGPLTSWIFDNATGVITFVCLDAVCSPSDLRLLAGFVGFATMPSQPTVADAANPPSTASPLAIIVSVTDPLTFPVLCFTELLTPFRFIQYFCAVPVNATSKWSGYPIFGGIAVAASASSVSSAEYRICRYTPNVSGATSSNAEHPAVYVDVSGGLLNQNYLVIRAGDGVATSFTCPLDDPSRPGNSNTVAYYGP